MSDVNTAASSKGKIRSLSYLIDYLKPYKKRISGVFIALLLSSSSVLLIGYCLRMIIDNGLVVGSQAGLNHGFFLLICVTLMLSIATCMRYYFVTMLGEDVVSDIRKDIFKQMLKLSCEFYEGNRSSSVISSMSNDAEILKNVIGSSVSIAMRNLITMIGALIMMSAISTKLFCLISVVIPIVIIPIMAFAKSMRRYSRVLQEKNLDISSITEESVMGIKTIQSYTHEKVEYFRFKDKLSDLIEAATEKAKSRAALITVVISLSFGSVAWLLWIGSHDVMTGHLTAGELSSFIFIAVLCAGSVGALTEVIGDLQRAGAATERIAQFMSLKTSIKNATNPVFIKDSSSGKISFRDVTFFYPSRPAKPALDNLNLDITPGKITAIVGESGAGKTTILQLLLRFYDPQSGNILFDDVPLKEIDLHCLRSQFAYVDQEPAMFSSTIWENVVYGKPDATVDEVEEALDKSAALDFVTKLPNGFYTDVGKRGIRLSTGQKQRLIIARAFLRNPKILLLDEATSALDSGNEKIVQLASEKLMQDRTTIVIAHRLSTIKNADKIIVMKDGKILEQGVHDSLMKTKGEYFNLVSVQQ